MWGIERKSSLGTATSIPKKGIFRHRSQVTIERSVTKLKVFSIVLSATIVLLASLTVLSKEALTGAYKGKLPWIGNDFVFYFLIILAPLIAIIKSIYDYQSLKSGIVAPVILGSFLNIRRDCNAAVAAEFERNSIESGSYEKTIKNSLRIVLAHIAASFIAAIPSDSADRKVFAIALTVEEGEIVNAISYRQPEKSLVFSSLPMLNDSHSPFKESIIQKQSLLIENFSIHSSFITESSFQQLLRNDEKEGSLFCRPVLDGYHNCSMLIVVYCTDAYGILDLNRDYYERELAAYSYLMSMILACSASPLTENGASNTNKVD